MYQFHISLHRLVSGQIEKRSIELATGTFEALVLQPRQVTEPMSICFEDACARLADLPQMFVEPDGSFVWTSPQSESRWQVDGVMYDRSDRLLFVDLKGACPAERFDALLRAFGWPETPMVFQLSREAVYLGEVEFRRFAAMRATASSPARPIRSPSAPHGD